MSKKSKIIKKLKLMLSFTAGGVAGAVTVLALGHMLGLINIAKKSEEIEYIKWLEGEVMKHMQNVEE